MGFLRRQLVTSALTVNALRPSSGYRGGAAGFVPGWLTGELSPQLLALTTADAAVAAARGRTTPLSRAVAVGNLVGLLTLVQGGRRAGKQAEDALVEGLGVEYVEQLDAAPSPADLATPWRSLVNPFRHRNDTVEVRRDLRYAPWGRRGLLDVYRAADPEARLEKAPVLLQVHGGGWTMGSKDHQGLPLMQHLAAKGWVCVAINYRLAPRDPFPAQIEDVKRAIAWIKDHIAEHGGDPEYLVITGGSAGGHLASLAALTPGDPTYQPGFEDADTSVQAAVPHYGVYDFAGSTGMRRAELMRDRFLAPKVVRRRWEEAPEVFEAGSPLLRVGVDAPDFFVIHGTHDTLVPVEQARTFVELVQERSRRTVVYAELPGAQHAFDVFPSVRSAHVVRAIDRYVHWHWNTWRRSQVPAT